MVFENRMTTPVRLSISARSSYGHAKIVIPTGGVMGLWPTQGDEKRLLFSNDSSHGSTGLPFVISTEAQRSGEICGSAVLSWKCFSTEVA